MLVHDQGARSAGANIDAEYRNDSLLRRNQSA
jgi:hypothetical protein